MLAAPLALFSKRARHRIEGLFTADKSTHLYGLRVKKAFTTQQQADLYQICTARSRPKICIIPIWLLRRINPDLATDDTMKVKLVKQRDDRNELVSWLMSQNIFRVMVRAYFARLQMTMPFLKAGTIPQCMDALSALVPFTPSHIKDLEQKGFSFGDVLDKAKSNWAYQQHKSFFETEESFIIFMQTWRPPQS